MLREFKVFYDVVNPPLTPIVQAQGFASVQGNDSICIKLRIVFHKKGGIPLEKEQGVALSNPL